MVRGYSITVQGSFRAVRQLDHFSEEIARRRRLPLEIDLSEVSFMRPLAVVGTVMLLETMISRGREITFVFPRSPGTLNYLLAIGMPEVMDDLGSWKWPEDFPRSATKGLRPMIKLTKFSLTGEIDRIAEQMADVFDRDLPGLGALLKPCHVVFSELADNVVTHSSSSGYVLAQRFEYEEGPVIDITVGDCGVGIRRALSRNPELKPRLTDDREALALAMTDGVSSIYGDPYRGYGLGHVGAELSQRGRWLVVRSGNAIGHWKEGKRIEVSQCGASIGTLVHTVIPC